MNKVIALTGASGAMGEEVLNCLLRSDRQFAVRVLLFQKEKKLSKYLKKLLKTYKDRIFAFYGDIANYDDCAKLIETASYVFHCAAYIPPKSDHDPEQTYQSNYLGTKNMVDAVLNSGRADEIKFVHIGTVAEYGNRSYPHVWGRVGDPLISSDYDCYSMYKMKGERYVLESDLPHFVSLRQTAMLHKYMFANNLNDGLMFHTSWNAPLEWVSDRDSGALLCGIAERDLNGQLNGFWNNIYNIGGGEICRITGYETMEKGFAVMGGTPKDFFKPNWNIPRNFHGVWFADSDELQNFVPFRSESVDDFWARIFKHYWYYKPAKIVPHRLISALVFKPLLNKNTNSPVYWVKHKKDGRVQAFYGGYDAFEKIGTDWEKFPLLCENTTPDGETVDYKALKHTPQKLLDHGYNETKKLVDLTFDDLKYAADFRGGECLSSDYTTGAIYQKCQWKCKFGHTFFATPFTVLRGGYWCPDCEPKPWAYGKLAKEIPFYAQLWYDTHSPYEEENVYPYSEHDEEFILHK